jgi:hypothetical protein
MAFGDIFKREITVKLDKNELGPRKDRLCEVDRQILNVQADKAGALSGFNEQLKGLRDEHRKLLTAIETGTETTEVEVFERVDDRRGEVLTIRVDTNKPLPELTRPLTGDERQLGIEDAISRKKGRRKKSNTEADAE